MSLSIYLFGCARSYHDLCKTLHVALVTYLYEYGLSGLPRTVIFRKEMFSISPYFPSNNTAICPLFGCASSHQNLCKNLHVALVTYLYGYGLSEPVSPSPSCCSPQVPPAAAILRHLLQGVCLCVHPPTYLPLSHTQYPLTPPPPPHWSRGIHWICVWCGVRWGCFGRIWRSYDGYVVLYLSPLVEWYSSQHWRNPVGYNTKKPDSSYSSWGIH